MDTFTVKTPARVEYTHSVLGSIRASFEAGDVEPKSEQELFALEFLVDRGVAEVKPEDDDDTTDTVEEEN